MRSILSASVAVIVLLHAANAPAQFPGKKPMDITISLQAYELSGKDAAAILQATDARLDAITLIQQVTKAKAKIIKLGTIKFANGARDATLEKDFKFEADPLIGPDGRTVDLNLALEHGERKILTSVMLTDGSISFLGTLEEPGKDKVEFVFLRSTLSLSAP